MKLAAVRSELRPHPSRNKYDDQVYVIYDDRQQLEKELKSSKAWGSWAKYKFPAEFREASEYKLFQERYESLCCGHLKYYDDILRNRAVDHVMAFRWSPFQKKGRYEVEIFLSPPPMKPLYALNRTMESAGNERETAIAAAPSDVESVDPPKPPPPPPPSMY
ncbi:MAG TPA: hypothetical protein VD996_08355 [Chitinophagaceae bacterium]|nr:hypothetical protein [Chitinophagaceae bacterium]